MIRGQRLSVRGGELKLLLKKILQRVLKRRRTTENTEIAEKCARPAEAFQGSRSWTSVFFSVLSVFSVVPR